MKQKNQSVVPTVMGFKRNHNPRVDSPRKGCEGVYPENEKGKTLGAMGHPIRKNQPRVRESGLFGGVTTYERIKGRRY